MTYPALLAFVCGFSSLSLEIAWVRLYGFSKLSTPGAFGFVLMAYLLGIAFGAHFGSRACRLNARHSALWIFSLSALILSGLMSLILPFLFGWMINAQSLVFDLLIIGLASTILAFVFPIAHHLGTRPIAQKQGRRLAFVYTSNVMGAALGPLVMGYFLLEYLSLQQSFWVIGIFQLAAGGVFALFKLEIPQRKMVAGIILAFAGALGYVGFGIDPHALIQEVNQNGSRATAVIENRHGIITIFAGDDGDDAVFGGNVYDGRTNLNPQKNTNGLERPLLMGALQPKPRRVLVIGLSIGTWLALVKEFPGVEEIDVVEINPGYLTAAQAYKPQSMALQDPRVQVIVDDARRWLRKNPQKQYDLIIMNTTWHWRSNSSLLLSADFLKLVRSRMAADAVLSFNTTGSGDAFLTANQVFGHAYRYGNFVYAADFDFRSRKDADAAKVLYQNLRIQDREIFTPDSVALHKFLDQPFVTLDAAQNAFHRPFEVITDQNMITEFKYGRPLY